MGHMPPHSAMRLRMHVRMAVEQAQTVTCALLFLSSPGPLDAQRGSAATSASLATDQAVARCCPA
jgi:hypothetical protein